MYVDRNNITMKFLTTIMSLLLVVICSVATPRCRIKKYDESDGLTQWHVTQMVQDRQGMMWFSTWNGLCRYDGYEFQGFKGHVGDGNEIATDRIRTVWLNDDGNIGCRVDDDLYLFNLHTYRFETRPGLKSNRNNAKSVKSGRPYRYKDKDGVLWTVYYDGKLTYSTDGTTENPYEGSVKMESARFCLPDRQGNLWVAGVNGIYKICFLHRYGNVERFGQSTEVKAFFVDSHNRYWVATKEDNAVRIFDSRNNLVGYLSAAGRITKQYSRFSSPIYCITQTKDGTIWMGSKPGGLYRLKSMSDGNQYKVDRIAGFSNSNVYDIVEDKWGRLWIATLGGGICSVGNPSADSPRILKPSVYLKGYPKRLAQKVRMIYITKDNVLLAATTDGLLISRLKSGEDTKNMVFRCHTREAGRKDALSCSATMNIVEDRMGRLFISTESGGINMIASKDITGERLSFRHFAKEDGLPTDVLLSVTSCGGKLLLVGNNSIMMLDPDNGSSTSFGKNYFLTDSRFSDAVPMRRPDGNWLFGLQDGMLDINMRGLRKSTFVPNIALTDVCVQGMRKENAINALDTLVLSKDERSLTLTFAALDYTSDADIRYMFALVRDGDDNDVKWNNVGHDHSVTLLDLDPGTYTLMIKSTNAEGMWMDNVRRLTVIVTPKFMETTLAHLLLTLLLASVLGAIVYTYIYIKRIRRQQREVLEAYLALLNTGDEEKKTASQPEVQTRLSEEDDALMRRVSAFVEKNLSNADIGVGDIAAAAAVSRSVLQRKMKQIMGITPLDFLKEARMKHACYLLESTSMPVSEVAYACGYSDPKYFSRSFKTSTGKSPSEWREPKPL